RMHTKVFLRQFFHDVIHRRHYTRHRDSLNCGKLQFMGREQAAQQHTVLVGRALGLGEQTPVLDELLALIEPDHGMGVSYVNNEDHDLTRCVYPPTTVTSPASSRRGVPPSPAWSKSAPSLSRPTTVPASVPSGAATVIWVPIIQAA